MPPLGVTVKVAVPPTHTAGVCGAMVQVGLLGVSRQTPSLTTRSPVTGWQEVSNAVEFAAIYWF